MESQTFVYTGESGKALTVFTQKSNLGPILAPYDILDRGSVKLTDGFLLLDVVEYNRACGAENKASRATKEDLIRLDRGFDTLDGSPG